MDHLQHPDRAASGRSASLRLPWGVSNDEALLVAVVQDPAEAFPDPALPDAGSYPALVRFHDHLGVRRLSKVRLLAHPKAHTNPVDNSLDKLSCISYL